MIQSIKFLSIYSTIFDLTFDLICQELNIKTPKRDYIVTVIAEYVYTLINTDNNLFINCITPIDLNDCSSENNDFSNMLNEIDNLIIDIEELTSKLKDDNDFETDDISISPIEFGRQI